MSNISFQYPYLLLLLLLIPLMIIFQRYYNKKKATTIVYSDISQFSTARKTFKLRIRQLPDYLRMLAVAGYQYRGNPLNQNMGMSLPFGD